MAPTGYVETGQQCSLELLGDGLRDTGCALKAFRSEVVGAFLPIRTLYSFMSAMAVAAEFRLCQIEVAHRPRRHGQSKYGLSVFWWKPLMDMIGILWFLRRHFPRNIEWRADSGRDAESTAIAPGIDGQG